MTAYNKLVPAHNHPPTGTILVPVSCHDRMPAPKLPAGTIIPDSVPAAVKPQPVPLIRALMPVIMVVAILAMVGLMVISGGTPNPMMLVFPLMMGMGLLMMFNPPASQDADETRRKYLRHLHGIRTQARENAAAQRRHENYHHPAPQNLWALVSAARLWERNNDDSDFLAVRIGVGTTTLCTPIDVADPGAAEDLDPVCAISLRHSIAAVGTLADMPLVVDLTAFKQIVLTGQLADQLARAMVAQLVFHHGPDVVAVATMGESFTWAKWLPHLDRKYQPAARVLLIDASISTAEVEKILLAESWTTIIAVNHPAALLKELAEHEGLILKVTNTLQAATESGWETIGVADELTVNGALLLARKITCYLRPDSQTTSGKAGLLELLGVSDFTPETLTRLWQPRGKKRLSVPIGQDETGRSLVIDLKESAHGGAGPHGLCVGATGSGKSELLRTLVVALAATHSPEALNFVLVDFKGGATFLGLDELPHTSAVITNLAEEAILVDRMYDAISGELNRRQEWLRQAGNFANVTDYEQARQSHTDWPAMPALVIVVDEFSELLGQHPDFADLFVAVGRLGRSLHVHLLLASQRLEEGRLRGLDSHLSYRIGLKTFSVAESRQVLGVPDAYHLPSKPGAGFYKSDADQLLRFHTAYVSGQLLRPQNPSSDRQFLQIMPWEGWEEATTTKPVELVKDSRGTLMAALVEAAKELGETLGQKAHQVWLPPLPKHKELHEIIDTSRAKLQIAVGVIDRPYEQRQDTLVIDFAGQHGHVGICGGPQSGKTTALRSIVLSLSVSHDTDTIRFYILDLAGKGLASLDMLPHVAGIAHRGEEEKLGRIIDEVMGFIDEPEPRHTFLLIDGWHIIHNEHEQLIVKLGRIAADGLAAGVHLVFATPRWNAVRPAIRDLISGRLELKLGEPLDSAIDRKAQAKVPLLPGRGITSDGESMLLARSSQQDIAHVAVMTQQQQRVPAVKMLPRRISVAQLPSSASKSTVLLGIGGAKLSPTYWDFGQSPHLLCFGARASGKSTFIATVIMGLSRIGKQACRLVVIDHRRAHLGCIDANMLAGYSASKTDTQRLIDDTVITLTSRLPDATITPAALKARSWWEGPDIAVIIDDLDLIDESILHPLIKLLPHARDIGLHIIAARKTGGAVRALYHPFLGEIKDQSPTVALLSADQEDGPLFGVKLRQQPPGRATLVHQGVDCGLIHIAETESETP